MYLFGFGSLINLSSAQKSFKRVLSQKDLLPVKIKGYERVWNAIESIQFEGDEEAVNGVFLNIKKSAVISDFLSNCKNHYFIALFCNIDIAK